MARSELPSSSAGAAGAATVAVSCCCSAGRNPGMYVAFESDPFPMHGREIKLALCVSVEMSSQHPHGCLSVGLSVLGYSSARLFISAAANANMLLKIIALIGQVALAANFIAKYIGKSVYRLH